VTDDMVIHDLYHWKRWPMMLAGARPGEELSLARLRRVVCDGATTPEAERHGEVWLRTFISYCERGGVGVLRFRSDGTYVLELANPLPSIAEAMERVESSWPELEQTQAD
jgi:hypothetical protein